MSPAPSAVSALRGFRPWSRHSLVLVVAGATYMGIGIAYALTDPTSRELRIPLALTGGSLVPWGVVFFAVGLLAILSSRWPPSSETWGYTSMSALSSLWSGFYLWGIVLGAPLSTWSAVAIWGLVSMMWWAIAGLKNPELVVDDGKNLTDEELDAGGE